MHIILGILGSIVTILYLVSAISEKGSTLAKLNPFAWYRRRKW